MTVMLGPYQPSTLTGVSSIDDMRNFLDRELQEIARVIGSSRNMTEIESVEPAKPRDGMMVYADGVNWNPGSGAGFYARQGGAWASVGGGSFSGDINFEDLAPGFIDWLTKSIMLPLESLGINLQSLANLVGDLQNGQIVDGRAFRFDMKAQNDSLSAEISEVRIALVTNEAALATVILTLNAHTTTLNEQGQLIATNTANIAEHTTVIALQDAAIAAHTLELATVTTTLNSQGVTIAEHTATIHEQSLAVTTLSESVARHTLELSAVASQFSDQGALIAQNSASIFAESVVRANETSALAEQVTTLTSTVAANTASLAIQASAVDGLSVRYSVVGTIDGETGGFIFEGIQQNSGDALYTFTINANTIINGDLLVTGSVTTTQIAPNAVTALFTNTQAGTVTVTAGTTLATVNCDLTVGDVLVNASIGAHFVKGDANYDDTVTVTLAIYVDGVATGYTQLWRALVHRTEDNNKRATLHGPLTIMRVLEGLTPGTRTISIVCSQVTFGGSDTSSAFDRTIAVMETRR